MRVPRDKKWMSMKPAGGKLRSILIILLFTVFPWSFFKFGEWDRICRNGDGRSCVGRPLNISANASWDNIGVQRIRVLDIKFEIREIVVVETVTCAWHDVTEVWTKIGFTFGPYIYYYMSLRKGDAVLSADKLIIRHDRRSSAPNYPNFPYQHKIVSN